MRPLIIAHRGASGYEYENSRAAFRRAQLLDADGVELDVHATRDGVLLVHHDPVLGALGPIADIDAATAATHRLPNGEAVPLLAEALAMLQGLSVWVEVKTMAPEHDAALLAVLDAAPAPSTCAVHSFDHRIVARLARRRPALRLGCLSSSYLLDSAGSLRAAGARDLWQEWPLIDDQLVTAVHGSGAHVIAWTVNAAHDAARLARLGVDALCGNYPDRLRAAVTH